MTKPPPHLFAGILKITRFELVRERERIVEEGAIEEIKPIDFIAD